MTMSLDNVVTGVLKKPIRAVLYGVDGIGKSTFASEAPSPIFIAPEDGTAHLDVARFPNPKTWADIMAAFSELYHKDHEYQTVVIDSADWAEHYAADDVCDKANVGSIEDIGYGKGYVQMSERFKIFLRALDALYAKGLNIIIIAHSELKRFDDPEHEAYDRYMIKMDKRNAPLLREWSDYVLFANYDTLIKKVGDGMAEQKRAISFGKRILHTQRTAAFDAKRRFNIPDQIELNWSTFYAAHEAAQPTTEK